MSDDAQIPADPATIVTAFVSADVPPFDVFFNRLAAWVTHGAYCHVECAFEGVTIGRLRAIQSTLHRLLMRARKLSPAHERVRVAVRGVLAQFPPNMPDDYSITLAFYALAGGEPLGVRVLSPHASEPFFRPYSDRWRTYRLEGAPTPAVQFALEWSFSKCGLPYDTMGALTSVLRSRHADCAIPDPPTWFCSNLALRLLQHLGLCNDLSMTGTTPNILQARLLKYIPVSDGAVGAKENSDHSSEKGTGGSYAIRLDQGHWSVVTTPFIPLESAVRSAARFTPESQPEI